MATDFAILEKIADRAKVGHLGVVLKDGSPRVIPINFVRVGREFFLHGAIAGEKFDLLENGAKVNFFIYNDYAVVPAEWYTTEGCGANHLFESCSINGTCEVLTDEVECQAGLEALNRKFVPWSDGFPDEVAEGLARTATFKVSIDSFETRRNMMQNKSLEARRAIIEHLKKRGEDKDLVTINELQAEIGN